MTVLCCGRHSLAASPAHLQQNEVGQPHGSLLNQPPNGGQALVSADAFKPAVEVAEQPGKGAQAWDKRLEQSLPAH